ncbi:hypothetical protein YC2023_060206 [Brassica napus]
MVTSWFIDVFKIVDLSEKQSHQPNHLDGSETGAVKDYYECENVGDEDTGGRVIPRRLRREGSCHTLKHTQVHHSQQDFQFPNFEERYMTKLLTEKEDESEIQKLLRIARLDHIIRTTLLNTLN